MCDFPIARNSESNASREHAFTAVSETVRKTDQSRDKQEPKKKQNRRVEKLTFSLRRKFQVRCMGTTLSECTVALLRIGKAV